MLLEEFLKPLGLGQVEAARRLGISLNRLNEIVLGKRGSPRYRPPARALAEDVAAVLDAAAGDWNLHEAMKREVGPLLTRCGYHPPADERRQAVERRLARPPASPLSRAKSHCPRSTPLRASRLRRTDGRDQPFVALVIYPTTPDAQSRHADKLARIASEKIRTLPGFLGGRVFVSEDGDSLVTITEWSDRESFVQFRTSEFGQAAVRLAAELHPVAHWLRQHAAIEAP
jgi:heme-degrading monooxygenase HmoA